MSIGSFSNLNTLNSLQNQFGQNSVSGVSSTQATPSSQQAQLQYLQQTKVPPRFPTKLPQNNNTPSEGTQFSLTRPDIVVGIGKVTNYLKRIGLAIIGKESFSENATEKTSEMHLQVPDKPKQFAQSSDVDPTLSQWPEIMKSLDTQDNTKQASSNIQPDFSQKNATLPATQNNNELAQAIQGLTSQQVSLNDVLNPMNNTKAENPFQAIMGEINDSQTSQEELLRLVQGGVNTNLL
ncbi:MAG TPA: hypothetical protein V6C96_04100 [Vampirovibrionales bacterium]